MSIHSIGYLQHGEGVGAFCTEEVTVRHLYADQYEAWFEGLWRKIYMRESGDYIVYKGEKIRIQYEGNT